jgi:hypothetical protein
MRAAARAIADLAASPLTQTYHLSSYRVRVAFRRPRTREALVRGARELGKHGVARGTRVSESLMVRAGWAGRKGVVRGAPRLAITFTGTASRVALQINRTLSGCVGKNSVHVTRSSDLIDEHQGFFPVRLSYSVPPEEPGQPEQVNSECQVRWKQEAGAWVPASFRIERRLRGHLTEFYTLSFEWISVNKPIQPELLTPEGLGVPIGTQVVDYRMAVPRRVGVVKPLCLPR